MQQLHNSYFSIFTSFTFFKCFSPPYVCNTNIVLNGNSVRVKWTKRANNELLKRQLPLIIELQLHFACMVKKHILFHTKTNIETVSVNNNLAIAFRAVQSQACDSLNQDYEIKKVLTSDAAMKMHPTLLKFDYCQDNWIGEYTI